MIQYRATGGPIIELSVVGVGAGLDWPWGRGQEGAEMNK